MAKEETFEELATRLGGRWLVEGAPDNELPPEGMTPLAAMRLISREMVLDGIPERNLATFVTTWMEPEAQQIISGSLDRNFIDHAEYPQTAEIEQRCIRMLANLFHAPGETTGTRTQGSSEAIMLGALSLKWKWRARREAEGKSTDRIPFCGKCVSGAGSSRNRLPYSSASASRPSTSECRSPPLLAMPGVSVRR